MLSAYNQFDAVANNRGRMAIAAFNISCFQLAVSIEDDNRR